uniref:Uncharacterized protein n=1 Tax=Steinernema glaseri TaxID=37863 RepID=A0A1I8ASK9_9BILA
MDIKNHMSGGVDDDAMRGCSENNTRRWVPIWKHCLLGNNCGVVYQQNATGSLQVPSRKASLSAQEDNVISGNAILDRGQMNTPQMRKLYGNLCGKEWIATSQRSKGTVNNDPRKGKNVLEPRQQRQQENETRLCHWPGCKLWPFALLNQ